ncbi:MAG: hypothetical protein ABIN54_09075 [candidate division WOR-3 bacterium]
MNNTQTYAQLFSGNNTIQIVHRLLAQSVALSAPLAAKLPIAKAPTFGVSADHRYEFRRKRWADISTSAGIATGGAGLIGAGLAHLKAQARLVKLGAGVDDEREVIQAALEGDTAFLQDKAGVSSPADYLSALLSNKAYGLVHHYLFQIYRGDIFNYADDGSTYGYGYGQSELVDASGLTCRGCIAFVHPSSNTTIETVANGGTTITFNDHMGADGTNYGRVGAYYLKPGMLLTIRNRTGANTYSLVNDGGGATALVRVMSVVIESGTQFPYKAVLGSTSNNTITLTANGNFYFTLASKDYAGNIQDSWYAHTLPLSYAAETTGYIHTLNRGLDIYSDMRGYSVAYSSPATLYDTLASLLRAIKARHQATDSRDIAVFCDPYYIEVMRQEVGAATLLTLDLSDSRVVGDPRGKINSIEVDMVPVIPDPYVGPGIILIRAVPRTRTIKDVPVEIQYIPCTDDPVQLEANTEAATYNGIKVPPMMCWMEEPSPIFKGSFFHKVEGYDKGFNYLSGWFGLVHYDPSTLGKIYTITL